MTLYVLYYYNLSDRTMYYTAPLTVEQLNKAIELTVYMDGLVIGVQRAVDMNDFGGVVVW